ncbi:Exonuclease [Ketogulonicigenium vulgare Y25]|uniref:Exonuclease superfamily protein n=2 Tax=Ketogulonicigenium vulgare TaxID=92945 RepID=F9Y7E2_KETVW|nr:Exonuclease [Ketogulonicigenium vulgare Y25]AEM41070.1 Exonuclease superfamily protein [Ketogulonicigenium vulgare WSH-001]ALJ81214.1 exonuclease [Ketogulonicigenium vulgare]AOZ54795.1 Exonuclease [Ketogulonicigenium vulgare]
MISPRPFRMNIFPSGPFRFLALDVETANYRAHSICQIGIAAVRPDNTIETWTTLIDPEDDFVANNIAIHGIRPEAVVGAPRFAQAFRQLSPVLSRHLIFQHSSFDSRCFAAAAERAYLDPPEWTWSDSVTLARRVWPELKGAGGGHGLGNLKKALGLQFRHHDAGEDARAAAEVVLRAEAHTGLDFTALIKPPRRLSAVR